MAKVLMKFSSVPPPLLLLMNRYFLFWPTQDFLFWPTDTFYFGQLKTFYFGRLKNEKPPPVLSAILSDMKRKEYILGKNVVG
jgi:hypothetical protein